MKLMSGIVVSGVGAVLAVSSVASADEGVAGREVAQVQVQNASPQGQALPPPRSDADPAPPPAMPAGVVSPTVTEQAGVGGTQAYGRAGVLELGGSFGFAKAPSFTQLNVSPSVGWFFADNLELSGIISANYINTGAGGSTFMNFLAEPSYHLPLTNTLFAFLGVGAGLGYSEAGGAGFALAPRVGLNVLIGRSGILTPAFNVTYNTNQSVQTPQGTLLAVNTAYGASAGYTVMW